MSRLLASATALCAAYTMTASGTARAFTFETAFTRGCHEELTARAAASVAWPGGEVAPRPTVDDDALAANVPFRVAPGTDRWTLALLLGARDNDTRGYSLLDLPELAGVHNGSSTQDEHCLRSPTQKFEEGAVEALGSCRAFIRREIELAVGPSGAAALDAEEEVRVALRFQEGPVRVSRYAFHMGRALHALQDSYAHSYRSESQRSILSVLNYVDLALSPSFSEARDGPAHLSVLDGCSGASDFDVRRIAAARESSAALLAAVAAPDGAVEGRAARVDAVLDEALSFSPGCSVDNGWCGSNERVSSLEKALSGAFGCQAAPLGEPGGAAAWALLLGLAAVRAGLAKRARREPARAGGDRRAPSGGHGYRGRRRGG